MNKLEIQRLQQQVDKAQTIKEKKEFLQRIKELKLSSEIQKNR
jgi:hypothetical protein